MTFRGIGIFLLLLVPAYFFYSLYHGQNDAATETRGLVRQIAAANQNLDLPDPRQQTRVQKLYADLYWRYRLPDGTPDRAQQAAFGRLWTALQSCDHKRVAYSDRNTAPTRSPKNGDRPLVVVRTTLGDDNPAAVTLQWERREKQWYLRAYQVNRETPVMLAPVRQPVTASR